MKIMLVDHSTNTEEAHWGTCELCEHTGPFDYTTLKFQADDGSDPYWVEAWDYKPWVGPYGLTIENMYDFAFWLGNKDFPEGTVLDFELLRNLVYEYDEVQYAE